MIIDSFPGKVRRFCRKVILSPEQEAWLRRWHPFIENRMLEEMSGISHTTLARLIREMGLRKYGEGFNEIMRRKGEKMKETWHRERRRKRWGMEQQTRFYIPMKKYTCAQLSCRQHALDKGYLLSEDCKEGSEGRYVIYYDKDTPRDEVFERNCHKNGFRIEEWQE